MLENTVLYFSNPKKIKETSRVMSGTIRHQPYDDQTAVTMLCKIMSRSIRLFVVRKQK